METIPNEPLIPAGGLPVPSANILLVDDNPANLRLLSQLLGEHGYHLRAATSGSRALASIELTPPDLILLDIRMPGMDGYQVCQQLKASSRTADIPVIFISALDDIQDKVRAFQAGGVDYIIKPFQLEEVLARVEIHLSLRRLQRELQEANRRMAGELALAAQVQASFLPQRLPDLPGWELAVSLVPARLTSGDFFDALLLPGGRLGLLIADVVDKGVGAALFMAMSSTLLRTSLMEHPLDPGLVFQAVNQRLLEYSAANQFVTVFLGMLDLESGELCYANAGHCPGLLMAASGAARRLRNSGPPLGVVDDAAWTVEHVQLSRPNDWLLLYTDGISEAENPQGEFYGLERLQVFVESLAADQPGSLAENRRQAILADVQRFSQGAPQSDDIAVIVLGCRSPAAATR
jgi:sigma-B regulation protein RsbU (phosphoserine phosphatase)